MNPFDSGDKFSHSDDELVPEKEPPSRFAGDYDPALVERSHAFSVEGEIQMWGDLARV